MLIERQGRYLQENVDVVAYSVHNRYLLFWTWRTMISHSCKTQLKTFSFSSLPDTLEILWPSLSFADCLKVLLTSVKISGDSRNKLLVNCWIKRQAWFVLAGVMWLLKSVKKLGFLLEEFFILKLKYEKKVKLVYCFELGKVNNWEKVEQLHYSTRFLNS